MIRHLYVRIYLTTLAALALVVVLCAIAWQSIVQHPSGRLLIAQMHSDPLRLHLDGLATIVVIALAVALAMYPMVRRLTRRLEALTASVDRFGNGDLAARSSVSGKDEVSRLASSFNAMADRVGQLLGAHSRMLANASHELRSPLTRIQLALALYETDPRPGLLRGIQQDCTEIDQHIEEILLASKLDAIDATVQQDDVDLAGLLAEESARLDIPFDVVPAEVRGDVRLLRRLIRNLLENALKHGGSEVQSRLRIDDGGNRILQVSDRGPGIPEAERERVFEPFYRPANNRESGNGWGLGLSLVRQITDCHQGNVRCLSRAGGGCVFELTLPGAEVQR